MNIIPKHLKTQSHFQFSEMNEKKRDYYYSSNRLLINLVKNIFRLIIFLFC